MRLTILIVGLMASTIVLFLSVLYQSHWAFMLSLVLQVLPVMVTKNELAGHWWYRPLWLVWVGASLLGARWLQVSEGIAASPVFDSFGPGYLIMAVLAVVWPTWFNNHESRTTRER